MKNFVLYASAPFLLKQKFVIESPIGKIISIP